MRRVAVFWESISARERWFLVGGATVLVLVPLYVALWLPWHDALARLREQVPGQRDTLRWMQTEAQAIKPLLEKRARKGEGGELPLPSALEQSARTANIREAIQQMQPVENDQVQVLLGDVAFDPWLRWVENLRQAKIEVVAVNVTRSQQAHKVNIRMTVQRAG